MPTQNPFSDPQNALERFLPLEHRQLQGAIIREDNRLFEHHAGPSSSSSSSWTWEDVANEDNVSLNTSMICLDENPVGSVAGAEPSPTPSSMSLVQRHDAVDLDSNVLSSRPGRICVVDDFSWLRLDAVHACQSNGASSSGGADEDSARMLLNSQPPAGSANRGFQSLSLRQNNTNDSQHPNLTVCRHPEIDRCASQQPPTGPAFSSPNSHLHKSPSVGGRKILAKPEPVQEGDCEGPSASLSQRQSSEYVHQNPFTSPPRTHQQAEIGPFSRVDASAICLPQPSRSRLPSISSSSKHNSKSPHTPRSESFSDAYSAIGSTTGKVPGTASVSSLESPNPRRRSTSSRRGSLGGISSLKACDMRISSWVHSRPKSPGRLSARGVEIPLSEGNVVPDSSGKVPALPPKCPPSSLLARMMSAVFPANPIPPRYRSISVSSLAFFVAPKAWRSATLPIFEEDIEAQKENVREYLAAVELLQAIKKRKQWETSGFRATYLLLLVMILYFVFVGRPLWPGAATMYYVWLRQAGVATAGAAIFMTWAALQTFLPLLGTRFEREIDNVEARDTSETALVIPAYKAAMVLPATIEAALRIFKPEQIFVINNGNTLEPQDNTPEVCKKYGINHTWVPIGSKIVAEFIGVAFTSAYKYVLLIDDDVHLPANLPLVTHRLKGNTKCVGYTIKSTGADGIKGTLIQQCQDMEYKVSGLTRTFAGKYGSATFPHGAIILWDREVLSELFNVHPGYVISEDWYFGHAARSSGYRIQFCSQVFVETETPPALFKNSAAARGGFGEMTLYKQRFGRWNYFFVFRIWEDTIYILFAWRLGWRELITKLFVMVEVYDSVMAFVRPFIIVITGLASWRLLLIMTLGTTSMYIGGFVLLNTWHLRQKKEMVAWKVLPMYMLMKLILLFVNSLSVYYGLYDYARYFSVRHPRVTENGPALQAAYQARLRSILVPLASRNGCSERNVVDQQAQIMEALTLAYGTVFNDTAIDEKVLDDSDDGSSVIGAG